MSDVKTQADFDAAKAEVFAGRLLTALNYGAFCLMASIGHRTGLFDAVHDQARPLSVLKGIYRALKSDGVYLMQDIRGSSHVHKNITHRLGTFLYTASCMHCMTVSLAQGGDGLGAMWGEGKTRGYLHQAGFRSIETHQLAHDIKNNWYVVRK